MASRWLDPTLSPHVDAYGPNARPYAITEVDEHVDSARIWATILEARQEVDAEVEEAFERGKAKGHEEAKEERPSEEVLFEYYRAKLQKALDELKKGFTKASLDKLQKVIDEG